MVKIQYFIIFKGKNTLFTKDVKSGDQILIKEFHNKEVRVKEILNDQEMVLFPHPSIPETVENINSPFKILPRVDQSKFFDSVYQHLGKGQCIGIFPEVFFFLLNL